MKIPNFVPGGGGDLGPHAFREAHSDQVGDRDGC